MELIFSIHRFLYLIRIEMHHNQLPELLIPFISSTMPTPRSARSQLATDGKTTSPHDVEIEKSTPYPMCYGNLLAGRTTNVSTSTSPGQPTAQPGKEKQNHVHRTLTGNFAPIVCVCFYSCFGRRSRSPITELDQATSIITRRFEGKTQRLPCTTKTKISHAIAITRLFTIGIKNCDTK